MWKNAVPESGNRIGPHVQTAAVQRRQSNSPRKKKSSFADDEADDEKKDTISKSAENPDTDMDDSDPDSYNDLQEFIVSDDEGVYNLGGNRRHTPRPQPVSKPSYNFPKLQPTFQPNSTPIRGNRQYLGSFLFPDFVHYSLVLNLIGSIISINQNTHHTIDIEFHETNFQRPIHFKDHYGFSLGCMSNRGAALAALSRPSLDENIEPTPSVLFYKSFESWASSTDWTIYMPKGEDIQALAIGSKWIAVVTSKGYMRIFSLTGIQSYIYSLPSVPVLSISGSDECLFVVRHANPHPGEPNPSKQALELV